MNDYTFEVKLRAVVRVRAASKEEASKVVESALGSPSNQELGLANENNNAALGLGATVTGVHFQETTQPRLVSDDKLKTVRHAA